MGADVKKYAVMVAVVLVVLWVSNRIGFIRETVYGKTA